MAYQMIHMEVAYRLLNRLPQIENAAEFILGSVAPDSVHMDQDFVIDRKVKSHMFEGCGKWSDTQDYRRWKSNIGDTFGKILTERERTDYRDFGIGLCVHCLTDYLNDIKNWRRLQSEHIPPMELEEFKEAYYVEARGIDLWLYQNSKNTAAIRVLLANAKAFDAEGLLRIENIEKQRDHLLNVQYDVETVNVSDYRFLPASAIEEFIDSVVNEIAETIELWQTEYSGEGSFLLRRKPNR